MNLAQLTAKLPADSIVWAGFGQPTEINLNVVTGDEVTPESNALESLIKLLDAAFRTQNDLNVERARDGLPALNMVGRDVSVDDNGNPVFTYSLSAKIDSNAALNNVSAPVLTDDN